MLTAWWFRCVGVSLWRLYLGDEDKFWDRCWCDWSIAALVVISSPKLSIFNGGERDRIVGGLWAFNGGDRLKFTNVEGDIGAKAPLPLGDSSSELASELQLFAVLPPRRDDGVLLSRRTFSSKAGIWRRVEIFGCDRWVDVNRSFPPVIFAVIVVADAMGLLPSPLLLLPAIFRADVDSASIASDHLRFSGNILLTLRHLLLWDDREVRFDVEDNADGVVVICSRLTELPPLIPSNSSSELWWSLVRSQSLGSAESRKYGDEAGVTIRSWVLSSPVTVVSCLEPRFEPTPPLKLSFSSLSMARIQMNTSIATELRQFNFH